jgi:hypothetical protein
MSLPRLTNTWLRSDFFPTFDEACLGLSRCPFRLLLWGVDGLNGYEFVSFSEGEWSFKTPVTAVSVAVMCGVHLADSWIIRGKFGAPKKGGKGGRRWRVNDGGRDNGGHVESESLGHVQSVVLLISFWAPLGVVRITQNGPRGS